MTLILTDEELYAITKRGRPKVQARILKQLGIPFTIHPVDGVLLVARAAASRVLAGEAANETIPTVDVDAIRRRRVKHGQTAKAGR